MTNLADAYDALAEAAAALAIELRATASPDAPGAPSFEDLPFDESDAPTAEPAPFVDTPQGRSKGGGCPVHGIPWTVRAAGTSNATGKPYSAFWKCDGKNPDDSFCREKPTLAWVKAHPAR